MSSPASRSESNLTWEEACRLASDERFDYTYDALGRLVAVHHKHSGDLAEAYLYDASDRLAAVIGPGGARQEFHRVDDQIVAAYDETGDLDWQAIWGPRVDQLLEWRDRDGSSDYIAMLDHRNSVVGTWDIMSGELDAIADYTADGRVTSRNVREEPTCVEEGNFHVLCDGPSGMPFGFNARWRSSVTGLTNMRARWYSARHGQFTSHDPLGYIDTQNLYAFAAFDPINGWDPSGRRQTGHEANPQDGSPSPYADGVKPPKVGTVKYFLVSRNLDSPKLFRHTGLWFLEADGTWTQAEVGAGPVGPGLDFYSNSREHPGGYDFERRWRGEALNTPKNGRIMEVVEGEVTEEKFAKLRQELENAKGRSDSEDPSDPAFRYRTQGSTGIGETETNCNSFVAECLRALGEEVPEEVDDLLHVGIESPSNILELKPPTEPSCPPHCGWPNGESRTGGAREKRTNQPNETGESGGDQTGQ